MSDIIIATEGMTDSVRVVRGPQAAAMGLRSMRSVRNFRRTDYAMGSIEPVPGSGAIAAPIVDMLASCDTTDVESTGGGDESEDFDARTSGSIISSSETVQVEVRRLAVFMLSVPRNPAIFPWVKMQGSFEQACLQGVLSPVSRRVAPVWKALLYLCSIVSNFYASRGQVALVQAYNVDRWSDEVILIKGRKWFTRQVRPVARELRECFRTAVAFSVTSHLTHRGPVTPYRPMFLARALATLVPSAGRPFRYWVFRHHTGRTLDYEDVNRLLDCLGMYREQQLGPQSLVAAAELPPVLNGELLGICTTSGMTFFPTGEGRDSLGYCYRGMHESVEHLDLGPCPTKAQLVAAGVPPDCPVRLLRTDASVFTCEPDYVMPDYPTHRRNDTPPCQVYHYADNDTLVLSAACLGTVLVPFHSLSDHDRVGMSGWAGALNHVSFQGVDEWFWLVAANRRKWATAMNTTRQVGPDDVVTLDYVTWGSRLYQVLFVRVPEMNGSRTVCVSLEGPTLVSATFRDGLGDQVWVAKRHGELRFAKRTSSHFLALVEHALPGFLL